MRFAFTASLNSSAPAIVAHTRRERIPTRNFSKFREAIVVVGILQMQKYVVCVRVCAIEWATRRWFGATAVLMRTPHTIPVSAPCAFAGRQSLHIAAVKYFSRFRPGARAFTIPQMHQHMRSGARV